MKNVVSIGFALLVLAQGVLTISHAQAQNGAAAIASADKAAMDRERAVSRRLADADRARAQKLFASSFSLWQSGSYDAARAGFERGLAIDPANGRANYYLGDTLLHQNDPAGARSRFLRARYFDPDSPEGLKAAAALGNLTASLPQSGAGPSTYQLSCSNTVAAGATLYADCRRIDGSTLHTQIEIPGVENIDGMLRFNGMGYASTFQNSCARIAVTGNLLSASCRRINGDYADTSIPILGVENIDGTLRYRR
jgi:tetratricopeptide (TPR) repeat protein